ncbi:ornithine decarboxylase-like isoform X2 [Eucyclogobius newberryi]|uniref:ornithine decarboxylase-like isoform X2 n=1 Tax=Eucyclogobius newberryi TaxID=166745 RepID=UPI003B5C7866
MGSEVPFFVVNLDDISEKFLKWKTFLPRIKPFYAVKCNDTAAVIRTLVALGAGFDCASKREIEMVMSLGVTPDRIIYAHPTKPQSHIRHACASGVDMMTFDSEEELLKISTCHPKAKLVLRISVDDSKSILRFGTKFGAKLQSVGDLLKRAQELHLNVTGVSFHVGSLCTDSVAFKTAIADTRQVFDQAKTLGIDMRLLDIGGGFVGRTDWLISFEQMAKGINEALDEFFSSDSGVRIMAEPGRYFVDTACTLAVNIFSKKVVQSDPTQSNESGKCLDKTIMYYVSDGVYGTMASTIYDSLQFTFSPFLHKRVEEPTYQSIIWGPTCDSLDRLTREFWMPECDVGEWLLVRDIGAYSLTTASDFNGFEKPQIYFVATAQTWEILSQHFF